MAAKTTKYQQVANELREQITSGQLAPATLVPSETQLMNRYGTSRDTVRKAITLLRNEGLITVVHGTGSIVRALSDRPRYRHPRGVTTSEATGGYADADDAGWEPTEDPATYRTNATAEIALALGVAEHSPVFVRDTLFADSRGRRKFHRLYLPFAVCAEIPDLETNPFRDPGAIYRILASAGNVPEFAETVRARIPTPDDAAALNIPDGVPMLITRRTTTSNGRTLALEETRYSADDAELAYDLNTQVDATPPGLRRQRSRDAARPRATETLHETA